VALASTPALLVALSVALASGVIVIAVAGKVHVVIPVLLHEVDGLAAGLVLSTVLAPVSRVPRRHAQVDWPGYWTHHRMDDDRLRVGGRKTS
jgi:hypothetical protein